ncbi:FliI/YscN family ATPase [Thalassovita taeanensis]|uniref:Flagellum-specific ATP synthase n=1 Tax=Thalassovita taeanensis TaxID=657014 RepID=A0A1H9I8W1_9RHOB|nr:FliI/YscN family ATPase [Thalassovita taeanensis]SEQ70990.1 flagellum-specific ATP synthase [Thalassovita taeanensis]
MYQPDMICLQAEISTLKAVHRLGRVSEVQAGLVYVRGLQDDARMGDQLRLSRKTGGDLSGEVVRLLETGVVMLPNAACEGVSLNDPVALCDNIGIAPSPGWIGRVIDPYGKPLDGRPLLRGPMSRPLQSDPPPAAERRAMGGRLETGMAVFNTMLPIVRGQRIGLFAGSGVGKSSLLAHLARHLQADVVVIALVGERGRELRDFIENVLGPEGMARAVVVAATSDQSPLVRRRCAWTAMAVAEYFREQGRHVLFLADSITRFAEAHREVAVAAGEAPALRGYPPSTAHMIMSLCERAGPGAGQSGDITAVLSVLVAGSDMDEPIADILRGVLDGHVILDRQIAERGRYPAIDLLRSVSRSLPAAASDAENGQISEARRLLGAYDQSEMMIRAGLYSEGSDALLDRAVSVWPDLDAFLAQSETETSASSFSRLELILRRARAARPSTIPGGDAHAAKIGTAQRNQAHGAAVTRSSLPRR